MRIEHVFEQVSVAKRTLNDFIADIEPWKDAICSEWLHGIRQKQSKFIENELKVQHQLAKLLEQIRRNSAQESEMEQLLDKFDENNPCSLKSIQQVLKDNQQIKLKIKALEKLHGILSPYSQDHFQKQIMSIEELILDFYDNDMYLLHICNEWQTKN